MILWVHGKMPDINELREKIDKIDIGITKLIESRVEVAREIGRLKAIKGLPLEDTKREEVILENVSKSTKLDGEFVRDLFRRIIDYCKNEERHDCGSRP